MAGTKRKRGKDSEEIYNNNDGRSRPPVEPRVDPTYGQRSAIPGLDDDTTMDCEEEPLNYDEGMDALSYLRAVRQEATTIPNLLVAPKQYADDSRDIYEDGVGDYRGYYEDGAYYTAADQVLGSDDYEEEGEVGQDPQLAYFDSILARFEVLRQQLSQIPPPEVVAKLGEDHPTYAGRLDAKLAKWWRWQMRIKDPIPAQIASMDKGTVLRLLGVLTNGAPLKSGLAVEVSVSRWIWGLLARLPERGELNSEEIGVIRELGKKAVLLGMSLREDKQWEAGLEAFEAEYEEDEGDREGSAYANKEEISLDLDEDLGNAGNATTESSSTCTAPQIGPQLPSPPSERVDIEDKILNGNNGDAKEGDIASSDVDMINDLAAAKARIIASLGKEGDDDHQESVDNTNGQTKIVDEEVQTYQSASKWNTKATVDMIITVAGEMFGQRDLLEFRSVWGEVV